jgi:hypothetical protein
MKYFKSKRGMVLTVAACLLAVGFVSGARSEEYRKAPVNDIINRIGYLTTCYVMASSSGRVEVAKSYYREISVLIPEFRDSVTFYTGRAQGYLVGLVTERIINGTEQDRKMDIHEMIVKTANEEFSEWCYEKI